jgi:hypothetical protein
MCSQTSDYSSALLDTFTLEQTTKAQGVVEYSSTLPLTSALVTGWVVNATPQPLCPRGKRPDTRYIGGFMAGLDGCGKSRPHQDSIPGPSSP